MAPSHARDQLPRTGLAPLIASLDSTGEIQLPCGTIHSIGTGVPAYRVIFRSQKALQTPMTELSIAEAFVRNEIDVQGDVQVLFGMRQQLKDHMPIRQKLQFVYDLIRTSTKMNAKTIGEHYDRGDDFYLTFIDKRFRIYSQGLFQHDQESIEDASEHKLETMFRGLGLKAGDRLLDIGGGWGGVTEYCGARGVHVTTLTIAKDSFQFIKKLLQDKQLPGQVFLEDFLDHRPVEPYDHAVMYGVVEHIPQYRKFSRCIWKVLKPGGRLYLDASAAVEKFAVSCFTRKYIWRGTHTYMTLQDVLAELLYHGFEITEVVRETRDYQLTMLEWAKRLDEAKDDIIAGWGEETYRIFRLFLWGGTHAFKTNGLQAYHLIAERTSMLGPRPSVGRRTMQFLGSL